MTETAWPSKPKIFTTLSNWSRGSEKREEFGVIWGGPMVEVTFLWDLKGGQGLGEW